MKLKIRIPKDKIEALKNFSELERDERNLIINKIELISPESPFDIVEEITDKTSLDEEKVHKILDFFGNFYINYYAFQLSKEQFIDSVSSSFKYHNIDFEIDEDIKVSLRKVLEMENSIGVLSKLNALCRNNPHLYALGHIITDLRHIYYNDSAKPPKYAMIKHSMVIEYLDNDNILKDIAITMNNEDLNQLKVVVDRAIEKEETIQAFSEKQGLIILKEFNWVD